MLDKLIFFNHYGAGDLFESREFVRELMEIFPANEYFYAHGKNKRMFEDFPNMTSIDITPNMDMRAPFIKEGNSLYINTWIGRDSQYVLPQIGCVVSENWRMFNDILASLGERPLSKHHLEYLPKVDYKYIDTYDIESAMKKVYKDRKKILICNGQVQSLQAANFPFTDIIIHLARTYPDYLFMVTENFPHQEDNIVYTNYIVGSYDGFDLNEISFISTYYTDIIIGRKSGPFCFAHTRWVWHNPNMKSLSFTYARNSSHFVLEDTLPLRKYWSDASIPSEVLRVIEGVINE